jgi:hypothetical protein
LYCSCGVKKKKNYSNSIMKKNPNGRPMAKKAPKLKVLVSYREDQSEIVKEFIKKLKDENKNNNI